MPSLAPVMTIVLSVTIRTSTTGQLIWSRFQLREGDLLLSMQRELMVEGEQSSLRTGPTVMTGSNLILR
jgi:hypothetical protein